MNIKLCVQNLTDQSIMLLKNSIKGLSKNKKEIFGIESILFPFHLQRCYLLIPDLPFSSNYPFIGSHFF